MTLQNIDWRCDCDRCAGRELNYSSVCGSITQAEYNRMANPNTPCTHPDHKGKHINALSLDDEISVLDSVDGVGLLDHTADQALCAEHAVGLAVKVARNAT